MKIIITLLIISEKTEEIDKNEDVDNKLTTEETEPEFEAENDTLDEEFNQEIEEVLLDIPTFLRRQAN